MSPFIVTRHAFGKHPRREITAPEFEKLREVPVRLAEALAFEERADLFLANYEEFESELLNATLTHAVYGVAMRTWSDGMALRQRFARRLANLLTTTKAYCDALPHVMNSIYGKGSDEGSQVKRWLSEEYDATLGYRVCDALRNFVQHRGFPVHGINTHMAWEKRPAKPDLMVHYSTPKLSVAVLEQEGGFKASVLKELSALGDEHDLKPFVRQYIDALGRVHNKARGLLKKDIEGWDAFIASFVDAFVADPLSEGDALGLAAMELDEHGVRNGDVLLYIMLEPTQRRKWLEAKNAFHGKLETAVVTSEVDNHSRSKAKKTEHFVITAHGPPADLG